MKTLLRLGTRNSPLATLQTNYASAQLRHYWPELELEIVAQSTFGDNNLQAPISQLNAGSYGVFVKELEQGLLSRQTDLAIHSLKDMPSVQPEGLAVAMLGPRASVRDAFLQPRGVSFFDLPAGATVGTAARRRVAFLSKLRPDLTFIPVRGNVQTRLRKLNEGLVDGLVLAEAGLVRLDLGHLITHTFDPLAHSVPAPGQGLLAMEYRAEDKATLQRLAPLLDETWTAIATAERQVMRRLEGGCQLPLGVYCHQSETGQFHIITALASEDGTQFVQESTKFAQASEAFVTADKLSDKLLAQAEVRCILKEFKA